MHSILKISRKTVELGYYLDLRYNKGLFLLLSYFVLDCDFE